MLYLDDKVKREKVENRIFNVSMSQYLVHLHSDNRKCRKILSDTNIYLKINSRSTLEV